MWCSFHSILRIIVPLMVIMNFLLNSSLLILMCCYVFDLGLLVIMTVYTTCCAKFPSLPKDLKNDAASQVEIAKRVVTGTSDDAPLYRQLQQLSL